MRGGHVNLCGCFPTGRHYPGIADRIAQVVDLIEGLAEAFESSDHWVRLPIAVIDFETTGLDPVQDRILEIGIVCFDHGEVGERINLLVDPGIPVPEEARKVHGITDEELANAPRFEDIFPEVVRLLSGRLPVAYNAEFDRAFLHAELARLTFDFEGTIPPALDAGVRWVDPLVWVRELQQEEKSKKLAEVCERLGIPLDNAHRAASDAEAAGRVLLALAMQMPRTYGELIRIQTRYAAHQETEMVWRPRRT